MAHRRMPRQISRAETSLVRPMQISPVPVGEVENHNLNRHPDPAGEVEGYAVPSTVQVATNVKLPPTVAPASL